MLMQDLWSKNFITTHLLGIPSNLACRTITATASRARSIMHEKDGYQRSINSGMQVPTNRTRIAQVGSESGLEKPFKRKKLHE